ncbi:flavin reductase family protein [Sphingomonas sp. 1P06PA]|uniref:flavin reductase family protein n=1 Tax=Sphingomonas sp. 1P06PA TaxID=554121 RepID=UPI0039A769EB
MKLAFAWTFRRPQKEEKVMDDGADIPTQMRLALRRLAKAVVVITCRHQGQRFAMAATAVSELSMEPPSLLICVNRTASLFAPLSAGADFCVNILHSSQETISAVCSGKLKGEARFEQGNWSVSAQLGIPHLADAQAAFACRNDRQIDYGTHAIFIGVVAEVYQHGEVDPLVYVDGGYAAVGFVKANAPAVRAG